MSKNTAPNRSAANPHSSPPAAGRKLQVESCRLATNAQPATCNLQPATKALGVTPPHTEVRLEQGFEVYRLRNERLEIAVVPKLGAKIISLKNLRTGREWMWHPAAGRRLFRNRLGDDFSRSPSSGPTNACPPSRPARRRGASYPTTARSGAPPGRWTAKPGSREC